MYVLQNVIAAAADAVKAEAQASVSGLSQENARGARAPRRNIERMLTLFDDCWGGGGGYRFWKLYRGETNTRNVYFYI